MGKRSRKRTYHRYTPAVKPVPATKNKPAVKGSPGTSFTSTEYEQLPSRPSISGNPQVVMILLVALFIVVTWNDLSSGIASIIWDPSSKQNITNLNWGKYIGMILFIPIAVFISMTGDESAGVILMLTLGIWTVYLVENKGGNITSLLNWVNTVSGKSQVNKK